MRKSLLTVLLALLALLCTGSIFGKPNSTNFNIYGYRANEGGGGKLDVKWMKGNLGNSWAEGEWVPYKLVIENAQADYPLLIGLPDIEISFDFTNKGHRFIDLERGFQVSTNDLSNSQGWPADGGGAYSTTTRNEIEDAQNDVGNTGDLENEWTGFLLLKNAAPVSYGSVIQTLVNRDLGGGDGTPTDQRHIFIIPRAAIIEALGDSTMDQIVIYWQVHESRTFIWLNSLQEGYDTPPADNWGGISIPQLLIIPTLEPLPDSYLVPRDICILKMSAEARTYRFLSQNSYPEQLQV